MTPQSKNQLFFFLSIFAGAFILYPFLDYQAVMATGDHGRDLYAAAVTLQGHAPYRDYWWVYGPAMPYYYALFFKLLGVHVPALLTGKALLNLTSALLVYGTLLSATVTPGLALIGAAWFLVFAPDFFITYNHTGGLTLLLAVAFCAVHYLRERKTIALYFGLGCVFFLALVKPNFGVTALFCLTAVAAGVDRVYKHPLDREKKIFYFAAIALPVLVFLIYAWFLRGLPVYAIRQCLPYLGDDQPYHTSLLTGARMLIDSIAANIGATWQNLCLSAVVVASIAQTARLTGSKEMKPKERTQLLATVAAFALFYVTSVHEFVLSGVVYRSFWAKPFAYLLIFFFLHVATKDLRKIVRGLLYATLLLILGVQTFYLQRYIRTVKVAPQYLGTEKGKAFLGNETPWIATVDQTVSYLKDNLRENELFFALPYDPLYYFLAGKVSPTRQLIFFEHIKIPPRQEQETIVELEKNKVNWIVVSSRHHATKEYGMGILGKTYCPLIGEYIEKNFMIVAQFGDWENEPGWAGNHGTKILRRKPAT